MNPIQPMKSVEPMKCPHCGAEMELHTFEEFQTTIYGGLEPIWLCPSASCRHLRPKAIHDAIRLRDFEHPEIIMARNGIPERFQKCSFGNFHSNPKAVRFCQKHDMGKSLYIVGGAGRGKTHFVSAQARELVKGGYHDFFFISAAKLFDLLAGAAFNHDKREGTEQEIIERCINVGILFLDDLGQHGASNWIISKLYLIIDQRYSRNLPMITTSNFNLTDIRARLGEPIASRLSEGRIVRITGSDYRTTRGQKGGDYENEQ